MRTTLALLCLLTPTTSLFAADDPWLQAMEHEHAGDHPVPAMAADAAGAETMEGHTVDYGTIDGTTLSGYLAGSGSSGILVIHEWWGLNDNIRVIARELAAAGYTALAVDLYEGQSADDADGARALVGAASEHPERLDENLRQAYAYLKETVGVEKVGVIGWCFGGGWSLRTALLLGDGIDATVIYYGRLETDPEALAPLTSPVLGLFGSEDSGIPPESVHAFESALQGMGRQVSVHIYEGANHAFANPSGTRYQPEAAADAWAKTLAFLKAHL